MVIGMKDKKALNILDSWATHYFGNNHNWKDVKGFSDSTKAYIFEMESLAKYISKDFSNENTNRLLKLQVKLLEMIEKDRKSYNPKVLERLDTLIKLNKLRGRDTS